MEIVNAVSKVRFASSGPQHVHLARGRGVRADLICMEAGQKDRSVEGPCAVYVITGLASLTASGRADKDSQSAPAGHMAHLDEGEARAITNAGEGRLICLLFRPAE